MQSRWKPALQGTQHAYVFYEWWKQLQWPVVRDDGSYDVHEDYQDIACFGISWVELVINFAISMGWFFPVRVSGAGAQSVFKNYTDIEVQSLPNSVRTAAKQSVSCQDFFRTLVTVSEHPWLPDHVTEGSVSLQRMGFGGITKGLRPRPFLPNQLETIRFVRQYLVNLEGSSKLSGTLDSIKPVRVYHLPAGIVEPTPCSRFLAYQKLVKRRKRRE